MSEYVIVTDSSADLDAAEVKELDLQVIPLKFTLNGVTYSDYPDNRDMDPHEFYDRLRSGEVATTAALNMEDAKGVFEPILKDGKDVLMLAFSSGLSSSCQACLLAAGELAEEYPDRKIYVVDTLCASRGQGLLVYHTVMKKRAGATLEEARDFAENNKLHLCHWFTVDDLMFLKRGGRVSATAAALGTMLSIKPVLHVDDEGHLINMSKSRGRKGSIKAMVDKAAELAIDPGSQTMFICHGDCLEDAQQLAQMVEERFGTKDIRIGYTGTVIGAHSGPGTLALFFLGEHR